MNRDSVTKESKGQFLKWSASVDKFKLNHVEGCFYAETHAVGNCCDCYESHIWQAATASMQEEIDRLEDDHSLVVSELSDCKCEVQDLEEKTEQLQAEVEALKAENETLSADLNNLESISENI